MWIFFIVLIILIVYLAATAGRGRRDDDRGEQSETAEDILKKRYAKGEISKEEYERMKKDIM